MFGNAKDYHISGTIYLPSGVRLDLNGSRLIGTSGSAGSAVYSSSAQAIIETGVYNGSTIVTNVGSSSLTNRIVGSRIENGTFLNANCGLRLVNFHETSKVEGVRFSNCSRPMDLTSCYYSEISNFIIRNSASAVSQSAIQLIS